MLYIFGNDVAAPFDERISPGRCDQENAGAGRCAIGDQVLQVVESGSDGVPRRNHKVQDIVLYLFVNVNLPHDFSGAQDVR